VPQQGKGQAGDQQAQQAQPSPSRPFGRGPAGQLVGMRRRERRLGHVRPESI
jgi:hypothetical protein